MDFLFDIGKVLLDFDFIPALKKIAGERHRNSPEVWQRLLLRKDEFEAGRVTREEYVEWALAQLESEKTAAEFAEAWCDVFTVNKPMWEVVKQLKKQGHRLILFSNTNSIHCPWIFEQWPEFELFDGAVLSYQVGAIKPEKEIYLYAQNQYQLVPQKTRYIDDLEQNIQAGEEFGLRCHQYCLGKHELFLQWLEAELGSEG